MLRLVVNDNLVQKGKVVVSRYLSTKVKSTKSKSQSGTTNTNVPGLSDKCVNVPNTPVGPGASKNADYKNPEYFCYHVDSFGEAEVELAKYRLPAPSNKIPFQR